MKAGQDGVERVREEPGLGDDVERWEGERFPKGRHSDRMPTLERTNQAGKPGVAHNTLEGR